ncbi:MAG: FxsA family protein [Desulfobacterales bacterium]|nr:FxsA family protein [Desulfobacterales bacterium]
MFIRLLLIFSIIPLIELALLIKLGGYLGILPTIILVAGTGIVGISLARHHGFQLIRDVKRNLEKGQIPADHLIEGLLLLIGAVMLLTPGLLTDTTGFLLIIPFSRRIASHFLKDRFRKWINKNKIKFSYNEYRPYQEKNHAEDNDDITIDVDLKE